MIKRETGRHAKPRTLRRILRHLGHSYSKPRPVPCKTAPAEEQEAFKERVKKTILGVSGHGYAVLAVDEAGIVHLTSPGYGWCQLGTATMYLQDSSPRQSDCSGH